MASAIRQITGRACPNGIAVVAPALLLICAALDTWPSDGECVAFGGITADFAWDIYATTPDGSWYEKLAESDA